MDAMSKEAIVRRMTIEDLDQVMDVEYASFRSPWRKADILHDLINNPFSDYLVIEKEIESLAIVVHGQSWRRHK